MRLQQGRGARVYIRRVSYYHGAPWPCRARRRRRDLGVTRAKNGVVFVASAAAATAANEKPSSSVPSFHRRCRHNRGQWPLPAELFSPSSSSSSSSTCSAHRAPPTGGVCARTDATVYNIYLFFFFPPFSLSLVFSRDEYRVRYNGSLDFFLFRKPYTITICGYIM